METVVGFITFTKGVEYLIAISFLVAFIGFWLLVYAKKRRRLLIRIIPVAYVAVGIGILAGNTCVPPEATPPPAQIRLSASLVEDPGEAAFDHDMHKTDVADSCAVCHHNSGDATPFCNTCHRPASDPDDVGTPGLKAAIHGLCMSCHALVPSGPSGCAECHTGTGEPSGTLPTPAGAPDIAHGVVGQEDCLSCHQEMPANHAGSANHTCQSCHQP